MGDTYYVDSGTLLPNHPFLFLTIANIYFYKIVGPINNG